MPSQADVATIISDISATQTSNYCGSAASVLVVYEYCITLGWEVELFWRGKWTGAAVLFFVHRYFSLILNIYETVVLAHISSQSCPAVTKSIRTLDMMQYLLWAVFSTLRALALTRSYLLAVLVFCLSIVPLPINFTPYAKGLTGIIDPITGLCVPSDNFSLYLSNLFTIISRTSLITAEILLFCLTWAKLYTRGTLQLAIKIDGFIAVFLRDGTIYFIVLAFLNALHLIPATLNINSTAFQDFETATTVLWDPIATILVSRFLLDLQSADRRTRSRHGTTSTLDDGGTGSLAFERMIGSLGSSILDAPGGDDGDYMLDGDEEGDRDAGRPAMEAQRPLADGSDAGRQHCANADSVLGV